MTAEVNGGIAGVALRDAPAAAVARLETQGLYPLAARVFAARGIANRDEVTPALKTLPSPDALEGVTAMADMLAEVVKSGEAVAVVGDYDVDGVTATALTVDCLQAMGGEARWYLPNRHTDGYGLSPAISERVAADGMRHLLTVDNGITAHAGIARARALGMRVYVTDHHRPDGAALQADAVVNPHLQENCALENLAGVGIAFYLMARLRRALGCELDMAAFTDLVALGTIADCAPMDAVNRALTGAGLARIRAGKTRPGVTALTSVVGLNSVDVNCRAVGFRMAPRINAAGRMDSADAAMHCLNADSLLQAEHFAAKLDDYNRRRLRLQEEMMGVALKKCPRGAAGIVVFDREWHAGLVGIVAGKLADLHRRPAFVFHPDAGGHWRGSGRAPAGFDLIRMLEGLAAAHPGMALGYGGHSQAASIRIERKRIEEFAEEFAAACALAQPTVASPVEMVDAVSAEGITTETILQLERVVWGNGFEAPRYAGRFEVLRASPLRGGHLRLALLERSSGCRFGAMFFGVNEVPPGELTLVYTADRDVRDDNRPQLIVDKLLVEYAEGRAAAV